MKLDRRLALKASAVAAAGAALTVPGFAQRVAPVEGRNYRRLAQPQPAPAQRISVIEFFWYGCPHCYAFEPALQTWVARLPTDVEFTRVPIAFRPAEPYLAHQRIYYALQALGQVEQMHRKVFDAIHLHHERLDRPAEISALMQANGIDATRFMAAYDAPSTVQAAAHASDIAQAYDVDEVPSFGVQGRFWTGPELAGTPELSLVVVDYLVGRIRLGA